MKNNITKLVAAVLSFVFMFGGIFFIISNATLYEVRGSCVSDHFSRLRFNNNGDQAFRIPINEIGTCTEVAMSMLLSFYDFYWNDNFVPTIRNKNGESHEMGWQNGNYNSLTDTLIDTITAVPETSVWRRDYSSNNKSFSEFAADYKNTFLHPYLFDLANRTQITDELGIVGLLDCQVFQVLQNYLYNVCGFTNDQVTVHWELGYSLIEGDNFSRSTLFNTIKEQIEDGNPVIFLGLSLDVFPEEIDGDFSSYGGHAMIAYDVVQRDGTEDILLHTGWADTDRNRPFDDNIDNELQTFYTTDYTFLNSAIWIEINEENLPHECSGKYTDSVTGASLCSCQIYTSHPAHSIHTYHNYEFIDLESHGYKCGCGYITNIQPHNLSYSYYSPTQHHKMCNNCIYSGAESHNYILQDSTVSSGHDYICVCGDTITEAHSAHTYTSKNKTYHYKYCECGYLMGTETHDMYKSGIYNVCRDCGCMVNSLTDITIKGVEDELESETE